MKNKSQRVVLKGHTAGLIDSSSFRSVSEYGNPQKLFGELAKEQSDLFFVNCVLTEEGGNKNGLWFTQPLIIQKHASARLKPFNFAHEFQNIIGVMYDSAICDESNNLINLAKEISMQDGPDYHKVRGPYCNNEEKVLRVNVAAALYSRLGKGEVSNIIRKIEDGKEVAVSMECWVAHYDYYLMSPDGSIEFADGPTHSHLSDYVGKEFAGKMVYKVPRTDGFLFGGIGQVDRGACPASVILAAAEDRNSDEAEGNSAFDCLDSETVKKLVASLTDGANELKEQKTEGETKMPDAPDPNKTGENAQSQSGAIDVAALMNLHTKTSQELGAAQAEVERLSDAVDAKDKQIADYAAKVDSMNEEGSKSLSSIKAELDTVKKEAQIASYLVKLYRDNYDLACIAGSEEVIRHTFSAEDFSDEKFSLFISELKGKQDDKIKEQAALRRSVKCELLGLDPEKASDEEIAKAEEARKEFASHKEEDNSMPEKTEDEGVKGVKAVASAIQAESGRTLVKPQGAVIEATDTATQKVEKITV